MRLPSILLSLMILIGAAPASADTRLSDGDATIDAQWAGLGGASAAAVPQAPPPRPRGLLQILFAPAPPRDRQPAVREVAVPRALPSPAAQAENHAIDPAFLPALVEYPTAEKPGTIVIDASARYLYLVLPGGKAQRYGVGVGRDGFGWSGTVHIGRKAEWPTWTPPAAMRKRQPYLPVSMAGGPNNPLGARALYLHDGGRDTLFRIHGSNEPWTIGRSVSSGCFRMRNEDVIALYEQVGVGTKVVVR
jgi:lipoprotein-anchoring transpeptidase ErfK/SrfK